MNRKARTWVAGSAAAGLLVAASLGGQARQHSQAILLQPGNVNASVSGSAVWLANHSLSVTWETSGGGLRLASVYDRIGGRPTPRTVEAFVVTLAGGRSVAGSAMKLVEPPRAGDLAPRVESARASERVTGKELVARLASADPPLRIVWRATLREGAHHLRQELTIEPERGELAVQDIVLVDLQAKGAKVLGTAPGSPATAGGAYFGVEHPLSRCEVQQDRVRCSLAPATPIGAGQPLTCSSVIGLTEPSQLQPSFVQYVEHENVDVFGAFLEESGWLARAGIRAAGGPGQPTATSPPIRIVAGPYLQNPGRTEMSVMWLTDRNAASWVEYGLDSSLGTRAFTVADGLIAAGTIIHRVRITGLRPGTTYSYRVVSREIADFGPYKVDYGATVTSGTSRFRTPADAAGPYSFVVLNDLHEDVDLMSAHTNRAAARPPDLVFFNGDSLSHLESGDQIVGRLLEPAGRLFASLTPFVLVRGNHETRGRHARQLADYLALPGGRFYFSFDHGPVHFLVMDTGEDKADDHWAYSGLTDFDRYRQSQAEWLKEEVASAAFRNARFRVLVAHMPFFGNDRTRVDGHGPTDCRERWGTILNGAGLDLHIAGHTHRTDWVEPRAGANRFPIVVGGSSSRGASTMIRVEVFTDRLEVGVMRDDGTPAGTYVVKARAGRSTVK